MNDIVFEIVNICDNKKKINFRYYFSINLLFITFFNGMT